MYKFWEWEECTMCLVQWRKKRSEPKHIIEKFQYIMEKKIPKPSSEEKTDHRQKSEHQEDIKLSSSNTGNRALITVKKQPLFCF